MRVVIGGAHNGKRKFVNKYVESQPNNRVHTFEGELPEKISHNSFVVIGYFEKIIEQYLSLEEEKIVEIIMKRLQEIDGKAKLICICTDIGRGIVPIDLKERKIRDTCGRLYQQLLDESDYVCRIWYGIPQVLKGEEW